MAREVTLRDASKLAIPSVDRGVGCVFWSGQNGQIRRVRSGSREGQIGGLRRPMRARFEAQRARFEASEPLREPDLRLRGSRRPQRAVRKAPGGSKRLPEGLREPPGGSTRLPEGL